jgi:gluconolactonase
MTDLREIASGLAFPEGPVPLADGGVILVELARGALSRVAPGGEVSVLADCGGAPNGAAFGPDGKVYVCNNGGYFIFQQVDGVGTVPSAIEDLEGHPGGSIQRVDLDTGDVETLYTECDGKPLIAPNDLVFDEEGGFWFTDHGVKTGNDDQPGVLYARTDGSSIRGVVFGTDHTNGIGLSPAGDRLYVAETHSGRLFAWDVVAPGEVVDSADPDGPHGGSLLHALPQGQLFDSLAVDGEGWVNVATIMHGGITSVAPDGNEVIHTPVPDILVTNICFGGAGMGEAFITASATGKLYSMAWPRPGLALAY